MDSKKLHLFLKRIIDPLVSIVGLLILSVPFLIIGIAIKLDSKGPVFFRQKRLGKEGKPFFIFKFRTMVKNAQDMGSGLKTHEDDFRITRIGRILRRWGLDELPQLINVLKGEMSLVGPRPPVPDHPKEFSEYTPEEQKRFDVKPGITCLSVINGRNSLTWDERIEWDIHYVKNFSLYLDCLILIKTFYAVLIAKEGVYIPDNDK